MYYDLDEKNSGDTQMSPQLLTRNADADMSAKGQKSKRDPLKSNTTVVLEWTQQVHWARGIQRVMAPHTEDVTTSSMVRLDTFTPSQRKKSVYAVLR